MALLFFASHLWNALCTTRNCRDDSDCPYNPRISWYPSQKKMRTFGGVGNCLVFEAAGWALGLRSLFGALPSLLLCRRTDESLTSLISKKKGWKPTWTRWINLIRCFVSYMDSSNDEDDAAGGRLRRRMTMKETITIDCWSLVDGHRRWCWRVSLWKLAFDAVVSGS